MIRVAYSKHAVSLALHKQSFMGIGLRRVGVSWSVDEQFSVFNNDLYSMIIRVGYDSKFAVKPNI